MFWQLASLLPLLIAAASGHEWEFEENKYSGTLRETSSADSGGLCDASVKQNSGYFDIAGTKDAHYFYWMFESRSDPTNDPFIVWMTGGPGCSGMLGLLVENGPCHVNDDLTTTLNPNSWTEHANVLWIDQPTGVGFSYGPMGDMVTNEKGVGENMYQFLQAFFKSHPEYQSNDFYVIGESYGGHFVPATAHRIMVGNQNSPDITINLKGMAVGNGLTSPELQYPLYPEMAMNNTYGIKTVSELAYGEMQLASKACSAMLKECNHGPGIDCIPSQAVCNAGLVTPYQLTGRNVYDIRKKCEKPPLCYDFSAVTKFMNKKEVREAVGVTSKSGHWSSCSTGAHLAMLNDEMKNFDMLVPDLLENGINVLIYAGTADFICNWMGNHAWTSALEWSGKAAFNAAPEQDWMVGGKRAGSFRNAGPFTFQKVEDAGHMVPMDQPEHALDMIRTFTGTAEETKAAGTRVVEGGKGELRAVVA